MPYIEGCTLSKILQDRAEVLAGKKVADPHPWATLSDKAYLEQILPVLDMVLESVVALHEAGVLHRDIKPSNILIDRRNNAWLSDFGLARLASQALMTMPGEGMGTGGYMSPEQWEGKEDIDQLADVFSVGATLYKALTLELPYGKQRVTADAAPPVLASKRQPLLPRDFDAVLQKALEPERRNRYASAKELQEDWRRVRQGLLPRAHRLGPVSRLGRRIRRHRLALSALLVVALATGLLGTFLNPWSPQPKRDMKTVRIITNPEGAHVVLVPLDELARPLPEQKIQPTKVTPLVQKNVPVGDYLIVAQVADFGFQEVYRTVPGTDQTPGDGKHRHWELEADGKTIKLPAIDIPQSSVTKEMTLFDGGDFTMGAARLGSWAPPHSKHVDAFYFDTTEVSIAEYRRIMKRLPIKFPPERVPVDSHAVSYVSLDEAIVCAELMGKRLPHEEEYEFAASNGGQTRFPWGDDVNKIAPWQFQAVGTPNFDCLRTNPPVYGLFSNVAEWTATRYSLYDSADPLAKEAFKSPEMQQRFQGLWVVRGGPEPVIAGNADPLGRDSKRIWDVCLRETGRRGRAEPGLGFRCARSSQPRFQER
jgi:formylglycine-generating enzyme required for sulfatase activity